jgi:hypothetical protein
LPKCVLTLDNGDTDQFVEDMLHIRPAYLVYHYSPGARWFHVDLDISEESLSFLSLKYKLIFTRIIKTGSNYRSWPSTK